MCGKVDETVYHTVSECNMLAQKCINNAVVHQYDETIDHLESVCSILTSIEYKSRHDRVGHCLL